MDLIYKIILIYGFFIQVTTCLRLVRIGVPAYKIRGETAILECIYELHNKNNYGIDNVFGTNYESSEQNDEAETLYSVKWYKDNEEFFRYVPSMIPFVSSFRVDGIRVDDVASNSTHVKLRSVTLRSTGLYRCEVSAEAPSFASVQGEGRMEVVYLPKEGPHILGDEKIYQIGDTLLLNCTSGKSHPATKLSWFINDEPIQNSFNLIHYPELTNIHGLKTTVLGLQIPVEGKQFRDGAMRVRCLASLSPVLWKGTQGTVVQRRQDVVDNREAMLLVRSASSSNRKILGLLIVTLIGHMLISM